MRVLIAGGGVGGLMAGLSLVKTPGVTTVAVYERSGGPDERQGVELAVMYAVPLVLEHLGYVDARARFVRLGPKLERYRFFGKDGAERDVVELGDTPAEKAGLSAETEVRRIDLMLLLLELCEEAGVEVRFDHSVASVTELADGTVEIGFAEDDYPAVRGELLVAADGLRSAVRQCVLPDSPPPVFAGCNIIYGTGPRESMSLIHDDPHAFMIVLDDKFSLVASNVGPPDARTSWWALVYPSEAPAAGALDMWEADEKRARATVDTIVSNAGAVIRRCVASAKKIAYAGAFYKRSIDDVPERWHTGRTVLLGDAVHAMLPWSGAGASMAAEDAFVLARELATVTDGTATLDAALTRYGDRRRPRVLQFMRMAEASAPNGLGQTEYKNQLAEGPFVSDFDGCPVFE